MAVVQLLFEIPQGIDGHASVHQTCCSCLHLQSGLLGLPQKQPGVNLCLGPVFSPSTHEPRLKDVVLLPRRLHVEPNVPVIKGSHGLLDLVVTLLVLHLDGGIGIVVEDGKDSLEDRKPPLC